MRKLAIGFLLLGLTACGAATPASDSTGAASTAPSTVAVASTAPASAAPATSAPAASSGGVITLPPSAAGSAAGGDQIESQAAALLAQQLNKPADTLTLQSREEVEWSDGSLGCPDPATSYIQVITPGFKLVYSDGAANYNVHTNADGSSVIWCDNGRIKQMGQP